MKVVNAVYDETPVVTIAFTRNEVNLLKRLVNFHIGSYKIPDTDDYIFDADDHADAILAMPLYNILSDL